MLTKSILFRTNLDLHETRGLAFFDTVVLASAHAAGCKAIWTEDLDVGEVVNGVRISNPFA